MLYKYICVCVSFKHLYRAGEMAQQLRTLPALTEGPSSVPNTQTKWLTIAWDASSGPYIHVHIPTHIYTYILKIKPSLI